MPARTAQWRSRPRCGRRCRVAPCTQDQSPARLPEILRATQTLCVDLRCESDGDHSFATSTSARKLGGDCVIVPRTSLPSCVQMTVHFGTPSCSYHCLKNQLMPESDACTASTNARQVVS